MKGLYVHLPFCRQKCAYCGFYSETDCYHLQQEYFQALLKDLDSREERNYKTLYIGGGTPSSMDTALLSGFLSELYKKLNIGFAESTIEANPESIDSDFLKLVKEFGFSRLSIGCQSTSDEVLSSITRIHSADDIFRAAESARRICPDTALNLDLIYDIPDASFESTYDSLREVMSLAPEHISAYTYSFDTDFLKGKQKDETDFMIVREVLEDGGYIKYEISNFAKPGHESIHNINYWTLGEYDGLGASAWSLRNTTDKRILKGKISDIKAYISAPAEYSETDISVYPMTVLESLVFGLRMTKGVDFQQICVNTDAETREKLYNSLTLLKEKELLVWDGSRACLSRNGELLLDSVQEFLWGQLP